MKKSPVYQTPDIVLVALGSEGILCSSGGNEGVGENPGTDWDTIELLD
ncbi:MAG: hypothetical protein IJ450_05010 [Bacteroidales bacterium]|nr:hypothetical protein [Bacteroidales bacterium]